MKPEDKVNASRYRLVFAPAFLAIVLLIGRNIIGIGGGHDIFAVIILCCTVVYSIGASYWCWRDNRSSNNKSVAIGKLTTANRPVLGTFVGFVVMSMLSIIGIFINMIATLAIGRFAFGMQIETAIALFSSPIKAICGDNHVCANNFFISRVVPTILLLPWLLVGYLSLMCTIWVFRNTSLRASPIWLIGMTCIVFLIGDAWSFKGLDEEEYFGWLQSFCFLFGSCIYYRSFR